MITLSLHAPEQWASNLRAAVADWPRDVVLASEGGQPPLVSATVADASVPLPPLTDVGEGRAAALLFSREPLPPARLTAWARRSVCRLPSSSQLDWPTTDVVHDTPLPSDSSAVRATRREITRLFAQSTRIDDLVLAASELTANAVQHGHGPASLTVTTGFGGVVIEVGDHAPDLVPAVLPLRPNTASGRGMAIVDVISDCWGVLALAHTKIVWCEFRDVGMPGAGST